MCGKCYALLNGKSDEIEEVVFYAEQSNGFRTTPSKLKRTLRGKKRAQIPLLRRRNRRGRYPTPAGLPRILFDMEILEGQKLARESSALGKGDIKQ